MNFDFSSIKNSSSKLKIPGFFDDILSYLQKILKIEISDFSIINGELIIKLKEKTGRGILINLYEDIDVDVIDGFLNSESLDLIQTIKFFKGSQECIPYFVYSNNCPSPNFHIDVVRRYFNKTASDFYFFNKSIEDSYKPEKCYKIEKAGYPSFAYFEVNLRLSVFPAYNKKFYPARVNYFYFISSGINLDLYGGIEHIKDTYSIEDFTESVYLDVDTDSYIKNNLIKIIQASRHKKIKLFIIPQIYDSIEKEIKKLKNSLFLKSLRHNSKGMKLYFVYRDSEIEKGREILDPEVSYLFEGSKIYVVDNNEL